MTSPSSGFSNPRREIGTSTLPTLVKTSQRNKPIESRAKASCRSLARCDGGERETPRPPMDLAVSRRWSVLPAPPLWRLRINKQRPHHEDTDFTSEECCESRWCCNKDGRSLLLAFYPIRRSPSKASLIIIYADIYLLLAHFGRRTPGRLAAFPVKNANAHECIRNSNWICRSLATRSLQCLRTSNNCDGTRIGFVAQSPRTFCCCFLARAGCWNKSWSPQSAGRLQTTEPGSPLECVVHKLLNL